MNKNYEQAENLIAINSLEDIPQDLKNSPVSLLLEYHNLKRVYESWDSAQLLIAMCMDNRKQILIPENFSYIIRTGGGNLKYSEFKVSYAIAIGNVKHIVLIGHNNCGMVNLNSRKEDFINGLITSAGCNKEWAEKHFEEYSDDFEIQNEIDFLLKETVRLKEKYPKISITPMFYKLEDNLLYLLKR